MLNQNEAYTLQLNILSTLLLEPEWVRTVAPTLREEAFYVGTECRAIYRAIKELDQEGAPLTGVSLRAKLGSAMGDFAAKELNCPIRAETLDWSCNTLIQAAQLHMMRAEGLHLSMCQSNQDALASLERLSSLAAQCCRVESVSLGEAFSLFIQRQDQPKPEYLHWGIPDLDQRLFIQPGDFVVLGGYPSSGKTLLSLQFALEQAKCYRVGYFSLETGTDKLADRLMAYAAQLPLSVIKARNMGDDQFDRAANAYSDLCGRKLELIDAGGKSVSDLRSITLSKGFQVIVVDYLQLLKPENGRQSRYEQVTAISLGLHTLARQCKCAVIALAQLSRPDKTGTGFTPPSMSSFRESGQIEQDADAAMLLYPENPNDNKSPRVLKLAKNKEGERCKVMLRFDGARQTLEPFQGGTL